MLELLASGSRSESPWLWLVIVGGGVGLYVVGRLRGWRWLHTAGRDPGSALFLVGTPRWMQAVFLAIVGGGSLYHLATGHYRWFWWIVPAAAWIWFAVVVIRRRPADAD